MIIFSTIVSNITQATTALKNVTARYDRQHSDIRHFFHQRRISNGLLRRVSAFSDNVIRPKLRMIQIEDVELMKSLPPPLFMEVIGELYEKCLEVHVLFKTMKLLNMIVMQKICCRLKSISLSANAGLFAPGENAQCLYVVVGGVMDYRLARTNQDTTLETGQLAVEAVLWTPWVLQGKLSSRGDECELLSITATAFQNVLSEHPGTAWLPRKYGAEFVLQLNALLVHGEIISDLVSIPSALEMCSHA